MSLLRTKVLLLAIIRLLVLDSGLAVNTASLLAEDKHLEVERPDHQQQEQQLQEKSELSGGKDKALSVLLQTKTMSTGSATASMIPSVASLLRSAKQTMEASMTRKTGTLTPLALAYKVKNHLKEMKTEADIYAFNLKVAMGFLEFDPNATAFIFSQHSNEIYAEIGRPGMAFLTIHRNITQGFVKQIVGHVNAFVELSQLKTQGPKFGSNFTKMANATLDALKVADTRFLKAHDTMSEKVWAGVPEGLALLDSSAQAVEQFKTTFIDLSKQLTDTVGEPPQPRSADPDDLLNAMSTLNLAIEAATTVNASFRETVEYFTWKTNHMGAEGEKPNLGGLRLSGCLGVVSVTLGVYLNMAYGPMLFKAIFGERKWQEDAMETSSPNVNEIDAKPNEIKLNNGAYNDNNANSIMNV